MTECLFLISNILTALIRAAIYSVLLYRILHSEKPGKKQFIIGFTGVVIITSVQSYLNLSDIFRIITETILLAGCANVFQKANIRICLFISIFFEVSICLWNFLISSGLGILYQSEAFLVPENIEFHYSNWILHLLLIIFTFYVIRHPALGGKKAFRIAAIFVLSGFFSTIILSEQSSIFISDDTIWLWTMLSVVLMMFVLVFNMNRQYEVEKELARLNSEQAELLVRDYTTLNNAYASNAKLFHDFHNHIEILRQLISHEKYEKALQYMDDLQEPMKAITGAVWTGDETVDYLINSKMALAAANHIKIEAQIEFPRHTNILSTDLCAILGNLLDNALEAVKKNILSEHKTIYLTIRRINQMLIIKVENYFTNTLKKENGLLTTTKKDNGLHGWGLKSAQTAAKKYDGLLKITSDNNRFQVVVTLSYQGINIITQQF